MTRSACRSSAPTRLSRSIARSPRRRPARRASAAGSSRVGLPRVCSAIRCAGSSMPLSCRTGWSCASPACVSSSRPCRRHGSDGRLAARAPRWFSRRAITCGSRASSMLPAPWTIGCAIPWCAAVSAHSSATRSIEIEGVAVTSKLRTTMRPGHGPARGRRRSPAMCAMAKVADFNETISGSRSESAAGSPGTAVCASSVAWRRWSTTGFELGPECALAPRVGRRAGLPPFEPQHPGRAARTGPTSSTWRARS